MGAGSQINSLLAISLLSTVRLKLLFQEVGGRELSSMSHFCILPTSSNYVFRIKLTKIRLEQGYA